MRKFYKDLNLQVNIFRTRFNQREALAIAHDAFWWAVSSFFGTEDSDESSSTLLGDEEWHEGDCGSTHRSSAFSGAPSDRSHLKSSNANKDPNSGGIVFAKDYNHVNKRDMSTMAVNVRGNPLTEKVENFQMKF